MLCAGCGSDRTDKPSASSTAATASSTTAAGQLIDFDKNNDGGVVLRKAADVSKLEGTPDGFKQFMAGVIDTMVNSAQLGDDCRPTVSVAKFDSSGYALGSFWNCEGAVLMWAEQDGAWQQAWGGQSIPECADMKKYSIPVSIAGSKCSDGTKAVAYAG